MVTLQRTQHGAERVRRRDARRIVFRRPRLVWLDRDTAAIDEWPQRNKAAGTASSIRS
jgi:hypothetical protein